jgi:hypothetical protein
MHTLFRAIKSIAGIASERHGNHACSDRMSGSKFGPYLEAVQVVPGNACRLKWCDVFGYIAEFREKDEHFQSEVVERAYERIFGVGGALAQKGSCESDDYSVFLTYIDFTWSEGN